MKLAEREGVFVAAGGVKLHYRGHRMEAAPFRAVAAVMEAPEDGGRLYAELVQLLTPGGYVLYGCTHHERRRIPGQPGFLEEWNALFQELDAFLDLVRTHEPDAPLFLAGGQVSGQLVMTYALHHPQKLHGVIAYQPRQHRPASRLSLVSLTKALSRIWPAFAPAKAVDPAPAFDTATQEVSSSRNQPDEATPHSAATEATVSEITIPLLIVDGEAPVTESATRHESHDTHARRASLLEVEPWLDRILNADAP